MKANSSYFIYFISLTLLYCLSMTMVNAQEFANLDFSEIDSSGFASGWETKPEEISATLTNDAKGQSKSLKITKSKSFQQIFFQRQAVHFNEPKHFVVTADVKTKDIPRFPSTGILFAQVKDEDSTMIFYNDIQWIRGTADWQTYAIDVYAPRNAAKIMIGGGLNGKGTVWFSKFTFEEVPMDSAVSISEEAQAYLDEAIDRIQENAIASDKVNFDDVRQFAYLKANGADSVEETYPAIRLVIQMMADGHSAFITAEEFEEMYGKVEEEDATNTDDLDDVDFHERLLSQGESSVGYVSIPSFASASMNSQRQFADRLQTVIKQLDSDELKGWVIDLREDNGGSNAPMLLGLAPLFDKDEGKVFGYTGNDQEAAFWRVENGKVFIEDTLILESQIKYQQRDPTLPIAVLTGPITQSAGEAIAAAFCWKAERSTFRFANGRSYSW